MNSQTLIASNAAWKYLDNGTNQGTAWRAASFNDATWKTGNAELGYGDGGEATVVIYGPSSTSKYITTYFRKTFNVIDKSTISGLELSLIRDDGAAVYINGIEVYRNNLPSGTIYYNTLASVYIDGINESTFVVSNISSSSLINGTNLIAVEIHQNAVTSSDISFNLKLNAFTTGSVLNQTSNLFAIIGDYGVGGANEAAVATLVKSWHPEYIITTGDNNMPNGSATTIDANIGQYYHDFINPYAGIYGSGADINRFFPSLGNHDLATSSGAAYFQYFNLYGNERYYDFVKGSVHFFVINSNSSEIDGNTSNSVQAAWLKNRLASSTAKWKIVCFHHSPYSSDNLHGSTVWMQWPFKTWGADAVVSSHSHIYERIIRENFPYFVNGLGGDSKYSFSSTPVSGSKIRYNANFGAIQVKVNPDTLWFRFYNISNNLIDKYPIVKSSIPSAFTTAITSPINNSFFNAGSNIAIQAGVSGGTGIIQKVEFFAGSVKLGEDLTSPYSYTWNNVSAGNYILSAKATDSGFNTAVSSTVNISVSPIITCSATGTITREVWNNISGTSVSAIPLSVAPSSSGRLTVFEAPSNFADNYGQRISGYVCPPVTGNYIFWIASDDNSELWLSTNQSPANKLKIASSTGWTASRQWTKYPSQQSASKYLIAGQKYYIEALHKEGTQGDNCAVGWQLPSGAQERPIPGNRLSPYDVIPPGPSIELVTSGSSWKYLDNGTNQGTIWRAASYNDATWKTGNAELGYGDGGEATVVSYGPSSTNKYITTYFRKTFNVINKSTISGLELDLIRDDGAVVYINGIEVYRTNLPSGTIYYNTLAPTYIDGTAESTWEIANLSASSLINGTNVIAVEIHQNAVTSSDISFNLKLKTLSGSKIMDDITAIDSLQRNTVLENTYDMIVYPNPNTGKFNLEICIYDLQEKTMDIEVTNSLGQVVYKKQALRINGCVKEAIELESTLPVGVYVMKANIDNRIQNSKMLLLK